MPHLGLNLLTVTCSYNVHKGYDWFHLPLQVTNKAICWTALTGFALSQVPGILARMSNTIHGNSLHTKAKWLRNFLKLRKQLGLLSLWFLLVHVIMSLLLFSPAYYGKFFISPKAAATKMNSIGENSMLFAVLGTAFYVIMGLCSLPSIGVQMTNKQWQLVYGPLAWVALAFGTIHVLIMGVKGWNDQHKWPGNLPPITLTSTVFPLFVMWLKLVQVCLTYCRYVFCSKDSSSDIRKLSLPPPLVDETNSRQTSISDEHAHDQSRALVSVPDLSEQEPKKVFYKPGFVDSEIGLAD